eukprot:TRINITY_DN1519_c0_g1_i2.p2 TRINITY_DN1519_c0_g1~~TRINITY_DN1519_c0_g1_i2.p2  ORF type:complete len:126 (-),score=2.51 TRINITY_DN1519_c0_g1_i2:31-408(-)
MSTMTCKKYQNNFQKFCRKNRGILVGQFSVVKKSTIPSQGNKNIPEIVLYSLFIKTVVKTKFKVQHPQPETKKKSPCFFQVVSNFETHLKSQYSKADELKQVRILDRFVNPVTIFIVEQESINVF